MKWIPQRCLALSVLAGCLLSGNLNTAIAQQQCSQSARNEIAKLTDSLIGATDRELIEITCTHLRETYPACPDEIPRVCRQPSSAQEAQPSTRQAPCPTEWSRYDQCLIDRKKDMQRVPATQIRNCFMPRCPKS